MKCEKCNTKLVEKSHRTFENDLSNILVTYECPTCKNEVLITKHID